LKEADISPEAHHSAELKALLEFLSFVNLKYPTGFRGGQLDKTARRTAT